MVKLEFNFIRKGLTMESTSASEILLGATSRRTASIVPNKLERLLYDQYSCIPQVFEGLAETWNSEEKLRIVISEVLSC